MADLSEVVSADEAHCFNVTVLEAVPSRFGQLSLIALYSSTSLFALLGNLTVIVVCLAGSESARTIRLNLINLALSDIILGVLCVPYTFTDFAFGQWVFPTWMCITSQYFQLLSVFVTSITLSIVGVERYIATLHPFSSFHRWLCSHTRSLLLSTWLIGALYASTILPHTKTVPFKFDNTTYYECSYNVDFGGTKRRLFMAANFLLTFLVPMLVLLCSYSAIMRKLREDNCSSTGKNGDQSANGKNILRKSTPANHRSKTIKMLFTVILLYGVCWAPIKIYQFLLDHSWIGYCSELSLRLLTYSYFACHWVAMSSSAINPLIYSFLSLSFRNDFWKITKNFRESLSVRKNQTISLKTVSTNV